jgi:hypothetical protein
MQQHIVKLPNLAVKVKMLTLPDTAIGGSDWIRTMHKYSLIASLPRTGSGGLGCWGPTGKTTSGGLRSAE